MAALAEKRLGALKRKLEAMQYTDALDVRSAPLVERLVEDLLHTTESYRALKIRNSRTLQDLEAGDGQVRPPPPPLSPVTLRSSPLSPPPPSPPPSPGPGGLTPRQMQALRKDYERVVRENNELHQAVIAASEGANKASSSNYLLMKGKDDQIAELQFKVKQEKARNAELQVENSGLEERIDEIVRRSDKFKMANPSMQTGYI